MINPINNNIPNAITTLDMDPVRILPEEISVMIFSYFSGSELGKSCLVSRQWNQLASTPSLWNALDLRKLFPSIKVFDESDWIAHVDLDPIGLSVADASPSYKRKLIPVLKKLLPSLSIEGDAGVTVLTIPKGLTIKTLVKLAASPKKGNVMTFSYIWPPILDEIGDVAVDKTYRIVITNNILKGSRGQSIIDQEALLSKSGCEMPKALEAIALIVVTYMSAGERLYNDNPVTYTRCIEKIDDCQLVVGGFDPDGLDVSRSLFDNDDFGAACALRKL